MNRNIEDIVKGCQQGNARAQKLLYEKFKGFVMGIALRYVRTNEEAEDVFHDAFVKVYKSLNRGAEIQNIKSWIGRIAVNTSIDYYKQKNKLQEVSITPEIVESTDSADLDALGIMTADEIIGLLSKLSEDQRIVFNMYMIEGYNHKEIAAQLNIAVSTSRVILTRARKRMSLELEKLNSESYEGRGIKKVASV